MTNHLRGAQFLLLILWATFIWQLSKSGIQGIQMIPPKDLLMQGGLTPLAIPHHQWYRLATSMFLHTGALHLIFNSIGLWFAALIVERFVGSHWFLAIFFVSGLTGSYFSALNNAPNVVSAGASGGIMGLFAAMLALSFLIPRNSPLHHRIKKDALFVLIFSMIPISPIGHIDIYGHGGGAIGGALMLYLAYIMRRFGAYNQIAWILISGLIIYLGLNFRQA